MEPELLPFKAVELIPARRVLVVAPHPDDEIYGCGGSIALHRRAGVPVSVVILTGGDVSGDPDIRLQESADAALHIGSPQLECWRLPDRGLTCSESLIKRLAKRIEEQEFDLVYAPSPWEVHPDHRQASWLVIESLQLVGQRVRVAFYEVGSPLRPNVLLDITSVKSHKERAMRAFASQQVFQDYCGQMQALNRYRTYTLPKGVEAAEAYWLLEPAQWLEFYKSGAWLQVSPGVPPEANSSSNYPLVSVLIRSMGRDQLYQALDSISLQTYPSIEVVVVAATADHPALPLRCGTHSIRLVSTQTTMPRARAANVALENARGVYALFLDDDDWLMPSHVARLVSVLQSQPMARAVYTGVSTVDAEGKPLAQVFDIPFDQLRLRVQNLMPIHSVLFSVAAVRASCRFDESLHLYEDWDFWVQVSKLAPMVHLPGVSAVYRIHESSGVHKSNPTVQSAEEEIKLKWRKEISDADFLGLLAKLKEYETLRNTSNQLRVEVSAQKSALYSAQRELHNTQKELAVMTQSLSWRLTLPLRKLSRLIGLAQLRHSITHWRMRLSAIRASEGMGGIFRRIRRRLGRLMGVERQGYALWLERYGTLTQQQAMGLRARSEQFAYRPLISVLMPVYNTPLAYLKAAVQSVRAQAYVNWELCICDDASSDPLVVDYLKSLPQIDVRIKVHHRKTNGHISAASNDALDMSQGEWVALLDHDDLLSADALFWVVEALQSNKNAGVIYSDEDKIDLDGKRCDPFFKPDWSPELLLSRNYICHLGVYRRSLLNSIGGFRLGLEGAQDHDLVLRCALHLHPNQVIHIPRILYHWRVLPGSTALAGEEKSYAHQAGLKAIADYLEESGLGGEVVCLPDGYYRVLPQLPSQLPWVSLIIPTRNAHGLVRMCMQSIFEKTTYPNYDILLVDNGSDEVESLDYFKELSQHPRVKVIRDDRDFNFSALNNAAVNTAKGDFICLVNNDIEIITPDWLEEMVGLAIRPGVGAVGARLWYPNNTLQHGGVIVGLGGVAGHAHIGRGRGDPGYCGRAVMTQNFQAVTAACLLVRKSTYFQVGGLEEEHLKVAFNDIDFCLKLAEAGWRNVWTPYAEMYHHESATRGLDTSPEKKARFDSEVQYMLKRWGGVLLKDPTYNPNLSLDDAQFSLAFPPRISQLV